MSQKRIIASSNSGWKTKLRDVNHAILPPRTTRPNPVVVGNAVFAAIFSPGAVCSVDRRTGELLWKTPLNGYAKPAVVPAEGLLFAASSQTVYALAPKTGEIRWEFTPQSAPGEWVYSLPTVGRGRVFIGDRCGDFHCLDATTGKPRWRRQTSRACNNQVNATAVIAGPCALTANNAGTVACYDTDTGKTIWRQTVDGACVGELLRAGPQVIIGAGSLYALDLRTGAVGFQVGFHKKAVSSIALAQKRVVAVFGPDWADRTATWKFELVVIEGGCEIARRPMRGMSALRTCTETGLVYCTDSSSTDMIDPSTGAVVNSWRKHIALPDRVDGVLYCLTEQGVLLAAPAMCAGVSRRILKD